MAPGISVIMVTANEDVELARDTLKLGALDYVAKPFDFAYLERSVMASLVHAGAARPLPVAAEPWRDLVLAAFRVSRAMSDATRTSTGARLEEAALRAARAATRPDDAKAALAELELLLGVAAQLGGRAGAAVMTAQRAVSTARATLSGA